MNNNELFSIFVKLLEDNFNNRRKLGGLPINVRNALSQLKNVIKAKLNEIKDENDNISNLYKLTTTYFDTLLEELFLKAYSTEENERTKAISNEQVYNYLVTFVEKVAEVLVEQIPDYLYDFDTEITEITEETETNEKEPEKPKTTVKMATQTQILTEINSKLDILIKLLSK